MQFVFACTLAGSDGSVVTTTRRAPSVDVLNDQVRADGFRLSYSKIDILQTVRELLPVVSTDIVTDFLDFLADESAAGTFPAKICRMYAKDTNKQAAKAFNRVAVRIDQGMSLADSLQAERITRDAGLLGIIREGEKGGDKFSDTLVRLAKIRVGIRAGEKKLIKKSMYPLAIMFIAPSMAIGTGAKFEKQNAMRFATGKMHPNFATDIMFWMVHHSTLAFMIILGVIATVFGAYQYFNYQHPQMLIKFWMKFKRPLKPFYNVVVTQPLLNFSTYLMASRNLGIPDGQMLRGVACQTNGMFGYIFTRASRKIMSTHLGRSFEHELIVPDFFRSRLNTIGTLEDQNKVGVIVTKLADRMLLLRDEAIDAFGIATMTVGLLVGACSIGIILYGMLGPTFQSALDAMNRAMQ